MSGEIVLVVAGAMILLLLGYALHRDRWYKARWTENSELSRALVARSRETAEQSLALLRESLAVQREILAVLRSPRAD